MKPRSVATLTVFLLCGAIFSAAPLAGAQERVPTAVRELRIDPAKTGVPFGNARLVIAPLVHVGGKDEMSAGYKVEIFPFTSKSETGRFSVGISDADLHRLAGGAAIHFTGKAVSEDGANTSEVQGRASPISKSDGGNIRIQVEGKKGKLIFHSAYHLAR